MELDLPKTDLTMLRAEAVAAGYESAEAYAEELLLQKLRRDRTRNAYNVAVEAGMIDDAHLIPNDLSTNPEHLKGIGDNRTDHALAKRAEAMAALRELRKSLPRLSTAEILEAVAETRGEH